MKEELLQASADLERVGEFILAQWAREDAEVASLQNEEGRLLLKAALGYYKTFLMKGFNPSLRLSQGGIEAIRGMVQRG